MSGLLIIAGEASGDLYGAELARALHYHDKSLEIYGVGGPRMREAGVEILDETTRYASMGPVAALENWTHYRKLYTTLLSALRNRRPNVVVPIDFGDFNIPFGQRVRDLNIPIVYYISPQVWAWRSGRLKKLKRLVRRMLLIFSFELSLYEQAGIPTTFVGHPLLGILGDGSHLASVRPELGIGDKDLLIGLLPGSRPKQFSLLFPIMVRAAEIIRTHIPAARFAVGLARTLEQGDLRTRFDGGVFHGRTHELVRSCDLILTASGTATVEAAIVGTPMIVTYKVNPVAALAVAPFLKVKQYAMVNIIAGREIMPELYQFKAKPDLLASTAVDIILHGRLPKMREDLAEVRHKLGTPGASHRAADAILAEIGR